MTHEEFLARYKYDYSADLLGEGGFGEVFKAYDTYRDRWVAIKVSKVRPELEAVRLKKEVEMVSRLPAHPNIAFYEDCYTFREMSGEYDFGILQYYEHGNLQQLLQRENLTEAQKHSLLRQILAGIGFLHANGIIHRDLKPQNILIVKRGSEYIPKITDFGISKQLDVNRSSVFNNSLAGAGTLAYSSPEQLGDREIRKNTDLWSFGVIAFQTLTGALPFTTGEHAATSESGRLELFRQISGGTLPERINSIPEPWRKLIRLCLTNAPDQRIKDVAACFRVLDGENESPKPAYIPPPATRAEILPPVTRMDVPPPVTQQQPPPLPPPSIPPPAPKPVPVGGKKSTTWIKWTVGAVFTAMLGVIVVLLLQRSPNTPEPLPDVNDSAPIAPFTEASDTAAPNNAWEKDYFRTVSNAENYYNNNNYAAAKTEYNKALAQIPKTDASDKRNSIKGKIADCDRLIKEEADRKQQTTNTTKPTTSPNTASSKKYDDKGDFYEGLAVVKLNGKYGFIDKTGNVVIPLKYDDIETFSEGLARVRLNGKCGFIDKTGNVVIPLKYEYAEFFSEGLARVQLNGKWGYIDKTGNVVIPLKYDDAYWFSAGLAIVKSNEKYGYIDKTGNEVMPLKYEDAEPFNNGRARVTFNGKSFYIDKTGKYLADCP